MFTQLLAGALIVANMASASDANSGVLHIPLTKPGISERIALSKRDDSFSINLINQRAAFSANLEIGSNAQNVSVLVDTGSSDLWVMSLENPYCSTISETQDNPFVSSSKYVVHGLSNKAVSGGDKIKCIRSTMFDPLTSTSFSKNQTVFSIQYGDGTFANGTYVQDDIKFGGFTVKKANFAVADESDSNTSVWGIGLAGLESTVQSYDMSGNFSPTYSNLPMQLKEQGYIKSVAYSLWLNDKEASSGSLLFGGVDHSKYNGSLQTVPLLSTNPGAKPNEFQVKLDSISLYQGSNRGTVVNCSVSALLDSGTTYMMVPQQFLLAITKSIGGTCTESACYADCGVDGGLTFDFSGAEINVPLSELLLRVSSDQCMLGMLPASQSTSGFHVIMGDTFLRSAYVVFDLENYEVAMANTNLEGGDSNVEVISSGIPSAQKAARYSATNVANTFVVEFPSFFTVGGGSTVQPTDQSQAFSAGGGATADTQVGRTRGPGPMTATTIIIGGTAGSGSTESSTSSGSKRKDANAAAPQGGASSLLNSFYAGVMGLLLYI